MSHLRAPTLLLALCLASVLAGCGFHLRGMTGDQAMRFSSIHVEGPSGGTSDQLRDLLRLRPGLTLLPKPEGAEVVLRIEHDRLEKLILSVNSSGRVREYELLAHVRYRVRLGGREVIFPTDLTVRRDYAFDDNNLLGKDAEQQLLVRDMQNDAAQQIIRRLHVLGAP